MVPSISFRRACLNAFSGYVTGNGWVVGLARDLVDLVDVDNAHLGPFHVVVALLQELLNDVLDIFAHVPGFGERRRIGNGERYVEQSRERFREQRLAAAGGADQQDIRLGKLDVVFLAGVVQPLVMVVDRDREDLLGVFLADDVLIENAVDFGGNGELVAIAALRALRDLLADDVVAEFDALVADEHGRPRNELAHLVLALAAEGAIKELGGVASPTAFVSHAYLDRIPSSLTLRFIRGFFKPRPRFPPYCPTTAGSDLRAC